MGPVPGSGRRGGARLCPQPLGAFRGSLVAVWHRLRVRGRVLLVCARGFVGPKPAGDAGAAGTESFVDLS